MKYIILFVLLTGCGVNEYVFTPMYKVSDCFINKNVFDGYVATFAVNKIIALGESEYHVINYAVKQDLFTETTIPFHCDDQHVKITCPEKLKGY